MPQSSRALCARAVQLILTKSTTINEEQRALLECTLSALQAPTPLKLSRPQVGHLVSAFHTYKRSLKAHPKWEQFQEQVEIVELDLANAATRVGLS